MRRLSLPSLALAVSILPVASLGQSANGSPTAGMSGAGNAPGSGTGNAAGTVLRTAPSGGTVGTANGQSKIDAPTAVEREEQKKSDQATTICKGC